MTSYTYNNASQRLTKTDATGTTNYTYDPASELTSVTNPDSSTTTISHDALGDITGIGADSYTFNAAGEQASSTVGGTHTTRTYDYLGQIASQKTGTAAASIADAATMIRSAKAERDRESRGMVSGGCRCANSNPCGRTREEPLQDFGG